MCSIIYKFIICLLSMYVYLLILFPFNSQVFNVSNCILLNNYMVFMKKIFSHVVISMVIRTQLGTKTWHMIVRLERVINHKCQVLVKWMEHFKGEKLNHMMDIFFQLCYLNIQNLIASFKHCLWAWDYIDSIL